MVCREIKKAPQMQGVGAYDIWGDMGIGIPCKVYLGSTIRDYRDFGKSTKYN